MKRPPFRLPPFFPPYTPDAEHSPEVVATLEALGKHAERWAKRLVAYAAAVAIVFTAAGYFGVRGPQTQQRLSVVEDSVKKFSEQLDSENKLLLENIRVSCAVLRTLQPAAIVQPATCAAVLPPTFPPQP